MEAPGAATGAVWPREGVPCPVDPESEDLLALAVSTVRSTAGHA